MKFINIIVLAIFFSGCSFDDKTGIWKNQNSAEDIKKKDTFNEFKSISSNEKYFDKIIPINKNFTFKLTAPTKNLKWNDIYYNKHNSDRNFKYKNQSNLIFKSKKISKHIINDYLLYDNENIIVSDVKGNIIVYSISENKILTKYNFYKKKYKKRNKIINLILRDKIIYASDNFGYLYALDYIENKIIWAKNYKIPFRSNLKIFDKHLVAANQNNDLLIFNKFNGNVLKQIPTEETSVKNEFINNISIGKDSLFFLNTYGSLYSIDTSKLKINWFVNLSQSLDTSVSNLFLSNQILFNKGKIIISTNHYTYILNSETGSIIHKKNFSSFIKPLVVDDYLFLISKNDLLISMNIENGKIIYSYDINQLISEFLNTKKKSVYFKKIMLANNSLFIFLKNSYILEINLNGNLKSLNKLPSKMYTHPIVVDSALLYINNSNKLISIN